MILVHGSNLAQKERQTSKYADELSRQYLKEIRAEYDKWHQANPELLGPSSKPSDKDEELIRARVKLFEEYKTFLDQQKYAEQFDSRSNLHSSVLEEFLYYLFRDLVADFGTQAHIGKSHSFKDVFFVAPNYKSLTTRPYASIEKKDHDFVIGVTVQARLQTLSQDTSEREDLQLGEAQADYDVTIEGKIETHLFDVPAVAIECKTYLDKTMLEGSLRAADELKARNPNGLYIVVMEWLKLTEDVNLRKYKVDQIYVFRKQKNTDREYRYLPNYLKNPIDLAVVQHLFNLVRNHLISDWEGGVKHGLQRGWLL